MAENEGAAQGTENTGDQGTGTNGGTGAAAAGAEKTFTQTEVDRIIGERLSRVNKPTAEKPTPAQQQDTAPDTSKYETQIASLQGKYVAAEVKSSLAVAGVRPEKVARAVRLIDVSKCVDKDNQPDDAKIQKEIEDLIKDFPELKGTSEEGQAGFRIGADGNQKNTGAPKDEISSIFGNKKKG